MGLVDLARHFYFPNHSAILPSLLKNQFSIFGIITRRGHAVTVDDLRDHLCLNPVQ